MATSNRIASGGSAAPRILPGGDLGRPIRAAVISNPAGGYNARRNHFAAVRRAVAEFGVPHVEGTDPGTLIPAAREFDADGTELLIVNGGDGTVQLVLTALFDRDRTQPPPLLVLLPGGTSNTIPGDVGWRQRPPDGLRAVLAAAARGRLDGHIARRDVLRIESSLWPSPQCGMQFSAGAVYNAISFAITQIQTRGAHGQLLPAIGLFWALSRILTGRSDEVFPPMQFRATMDGKPLPEGPLLGNLVTTLDHLFLGIHPFWSDEPGRVRHSAIRYRWRRLLLALPAALRGRPGRFVTRENGFQSNNGEVLEMEVDAGFTLDGALFEAGPGTHIRITATESASFLRLGPG
jgi:hypothetical protein